MVKDFAGLLAQVVPVLALAVGLELRSLSQRLKRVLIDYQDSSEAWSEQFRKRFDEMKTALAEARADGRWGRAEIRTHYRALRDLRALDPSSEIGQSGMLMLLIITLVAGQAYLSGVEFYALTVVAGEPYHPFMSVLAIDLMAQLRSVIDVAFLAPAVEAAYMAIVFISPVRGERGRRFTTVVFTLAGVLTLRFAFGFLFG
jgi:hypothetical protein